MGETNLNNRYLEQYKGAYGLNKLRKRKNDNGN